MALKQLFAGSFDVNLQTATCELFAKFSQRCQTAEEDDASRAVTPAAMDVDAPPSGTAPAQFAPVRAAAPAARPTAPAARPAAAPARRRAKTPPPPRKRNPPDSGKVPSSDEEAPVRVKKPQARRRPRPKKKPAPDEPPAVPEIPRTVAPAPPLDGEDGARFQCQSDRVTVIGDERYTLPCLAWNSVAEVQAAGFHAKCCGCGARISVPERFAERPTGRLAWTNEPGDKV